MSLSLGIVGLPNVGKSTLFNALTRSKQADAQNYPFCTIEPNVGVIEVPDERLEKLADVIARSSMKLSDEAIPTGSPRPNVSSGLAMTRRPPIIPAAVEFYDIAGLVKGASTGEGLGNKFLSHIREVEAIVHVVRLFEDGNVIHVSDKINPEDDIKTIETELILADLETVNKQKEPKGTSVPKEAHTTYEVVRKVKEQLDKGIPVRQQNLNDEELLSLKPLNLLT